MSHCTIRITSSVVVLTGGETGEWSGSLVTQYHLPGGREEQLPNMKEPRENHACGSYSYSGHQVSHLNPHPPLLQMLIVAGGAGFLSREYLVTTEVYRYSPAGEGKWKPAGALPSSREGLRGATVFSQFYVMGGLTDNLTALPDVLEWQPNSGLESGAWRSAGALMEGRSMHAVSLIDFTFVAPYCL